MYIMRYRCKCKFDGTIAEGTDACPQCNNPLRRNRIPEYIPPDVDDARWIYGSFCIHRQEIIGEIECNTCGDRGKLVDVYACTIHEECTLRRSRTYNGPQGCVGCPGWSDQ